jgi:hypothetical protein
VIIDGTPIPIDRVGRSRWGPAVLSAIARLLPVYGETTMRQNHDGYRSRARVNLKAMLTQVGHSSASQSFGSSSFALPMSMITV